MQTDAVNPVEQITSTGTEWPSTPPGNRTERVNTHFSYEDGSGRFQGLYDGELIAQLGANRAALEEQLNHCTHPAERAAIIGKITYLDRCSLLFREAKRALQNGRLVGWMHRFTQPQGSKGGLRTGPIPMLIKTKAALDAMAKVDERRYGPAAMELSKPSGDVSEEHADAIMDAVIAKVASAQMIKRKKNL